MAAFIGWSALAAVWITTAQLIARVGCSWPRMIGLGLAILVAAFTGWFGAALTVMLFTAVVVWPALGSPRIARRLGGSVPHAWARALRRNWASIATGCGLVVSRTGALPTLTRRPRVATNDTVQARVGLAVGQTMDDLESAAPRLAAALGARQCDVRPVGSACADLRWSWSDTLAQEVTYPSTGSTFEALPLGRNQSGEVVSTPMLYSNTLIAGLPGQGKSTSLNSLLMGVALLPTTIIGVDLKGGIELGPWAPRLSGLATDPDSAIELLRNVLDAVTSRAVNLAELGLKKVTVTWPEFPPIVLVIDELAELVATGDRKRDQEAIACLRRILQLGRAVGVIVIACTQRPSSDVIPTSIRDLIGVRIGHFLPDRASAELVMGVWASEAPLHTLSLPGQCYVTVNGSRPERLRSARVDDITIATVAAEASFVIDEMPWPTRTTGQVSAPSHGAAINEETSRGV